MLGPVVGGTGVGHARPVVGHLEPQGPGAQPGPQLAPGPGVEERVRDEFGHDDVGIGQEFRTAPLPAVFRQEPAGGGYVGGLGTEVDGGRVVPAAIEPHEEPDEIGDVVFLGEEALDLIGHVQLVGRDRGGVHDHLCGGSDGPQAGEDLLAGEVRQAEVEHDDVGLMAGRGRDRRATVADVGDDFETALQLQRLPEDRAELRHVLDEQHGHSHHRNLATVHGLAFRLERIPAVRRGSGSQQLGSFLRVTEPGPFDVVVVDDADEVRAVVGLQLRLSRRFTVVAEGTSGADAITLAAEHRPAVMVLDASMPDMDGLEALPSILEASPATQVVMFSGFGGKALEMAARTLGAADFVEKSMPLRELPDRLLRLLGAGPGRPNGTAVRPEDLTAVGQSEAVLAQHLERFRTVFDQAAIGMATMTLAGSVVRVNPALIRLTGETEHDLIGRHYYDLTGSDYDESLRDALHRVARGGKESAEVEHSLRPVGTKGSRATKLWVRSTVTVVRDPDGRPLYLFAQAEDVTAQRLVLHELRASEERFRLLVESVVDYAIFMLDPDGHVSTWNSGAERMKGYQADEIVGQHFRVFYPKEAQDRRHPEHELELAVRDGRYQEEGWRIRKDGGSFWANVVITALFDHERKLVGFGKVTRDVTDRRRAEQAREAAASELAVAVEELRATNEQTADFLAIIAHELHSPITAMTGAAGILAEHWDVLDDAQRAENFENLSRSAKRTRRLLDELLMASRLEAGQLEVAVDSVSLDAAIEEAVAATAEPVEVNGAKGLMVRADRLRIVQIITNLLTNAARYGAPPVCLDVLPAGAMAEIRVSDAGSGVAEDVRPQLFRKFVRGAGRRDRGTGLGLFIVRELARRQGGDAWYERTGDGRTCFCFTIPRAG